MRIILYRAAVFSTSGIISAPGQIETNLDSDAFVFSLIIKKPWAAFNPFRLLFRRDGPGRMHRAANPWA